MIEKYKKGREPEEVENPEGFRCQVCPIVLRYDAGYNEEGEVVEHFKGWYCPNKNCPAGGLTQDHIVPRHVNTLGYWVSRREAKPIDYDQPLKEAKKQRRLDPEFLTREVK